MSMRQDGSPKILGAMKAPVILEAEIVNGESTIDFGRLEPAGATLVVAYVGIKTGDIVQAWGLRAPDNYSETQVVPEGATSLTFKVPKAYFDRKPNVIFQYFLWGDEDAPIAVSDGAFYIVTGSIPEPLPAPVIREAVGESVDVSSLPIVGATLLVDYPGAQAGDVITATSMGPNGMPPHVEVKTFIGAAPMAFTVPKAWFEKVLADGGSSSYYQYYVDYANGDTAHISDMQRYGLV